MTPTRYEDRSQEEVLLLLRAAIDTATTNPSPVHTRSAVLLAERYPRALAGGKLQTNLGQARWNWLNEHGVSVIHGVIDPDITT
jgi:hypothetical protein